MANKEQVIIDDSLIISNEVDTNITNDELDVKDSDLKSLVKQMITEQRITNKILSDAFKQPLYSESDLEL